MTRAMRGRIVSFAGGAAAIALAAAAGYLVWQQIGSAPWRSQPPGEDTLRLGAALYGEHCASCHGANLEGQPDWQTPLDDGGYPAPPHDETGHSWHHPDQLLFDYTRDGGQALAGPNFKSNMPGFGDLVSDDEIRAIIAFIRSTWPPEIRGRQDELNRQAARSKQ